jgi:hypothetical protein
MPIIKEKITQDKLRELTNGADMLKLVVDVEKGILSVGCELHSDCAEELLNDGSVAKNIWGANIHLKDLGIDFISLINIRPADGNRSMDIQNQEIRKKAEAVIKKLLFQ